MTEAQRLLERLRAPGASGADKVRVYRAIDAYLAQPISKCREGELVAALPIIVFALGYFDFGDQGITWEGCVKAWEENFKPALTEKHGGDCTNDCYSCARCQAEEVVRVSDMLRAALQGKKE